MRLTRETRSAIVRKLTEKAFPATEMAAEGIPIGAYIESLVPFQKAVKALADYPEYTKASNAITVTCTTLKFARYISMETFHIATSVPYAAMQGSGHYGYASDKRYRYGTTRRRSLRYTRRTWH